MSAPPGNLPPAQANSNLPGRPTALPPNFNPPPNFANINFNAPVIRLGTMGSGKDGSSASPGGMGDSGARRGLGMGGGSDQRPRENAALIPPTREEVMRTLFIGKIPSSMLDMELERILRAAGRLRKWTRAIDASEKVCSFGFAEFEDAESLENAIEVLPGIEVPATKPEVVEDRNDDTQEVERVKLLVQIDDASRKYALNWADTRNESDEVIENRLDTARQNVASVLNAIFNPSKMSRDFDGDISMRGAEFKADPLTGEIITIPLSADDELADIPAEMRETVAAEIAAFRHRSTERDMDRLKREKEAEAAEKRGARYNRLGSPPRSAPTGPSASNGIPVGPRGAPTGPRGHQNGVNGTTQQPLLYVTAEEEDESDASDEELERRRREKKEAEQEKHYLDMERKWLNRERSKTGALDREKARDDDEVSTVNRAKEAMAKQLREFKDDSESTRRGEEFYRDRSSWARSRQALLKRERKLDEEDRQQQQREQAKQNPREDTRDQRTTVGAAQPDREQHEQALQPKFKMSLGAAAQQRAQAAASSARRTVAEVEGLLEDEEEEETTTKRTLIPLQYDKLDAVALTDEERAQAAKQLAADVPTSKQGLWAWDMKWEFVDEAVMQEQIRPFVEKKIMEYLGVQEEMLVDVVEEHIKNRGSPEELVSELEGVSHKLPFFFMIQC
jgi:hypothetical protein